MIAVIGFLKTHLISLLSGLFGLVFIAVAVLGMMSGKVVRQMEERAAVIAKIRSLKSAPKNEACIQAEAERGRRFEQEYTETLSIAQRINERQPLRQGVFPVPESETAAYLFREEYKRAMRQLPAGALQAGSLPTAGDIQDAERDIAELREQQAQEDKEGPMLASIVDRLAQASSERPSGYQPPQQYNPYAAVPGGVPPVGPGAYAPSETADRRSRDYDPRYDPRARAQVNKARSIRCYISPPDSERPTFHISPIYDEAVKPSPEEMWYAQVGLWVQQDVVAAVAELNEEAARNLKDGEDYVENMPVKRLETIRVLGYWTSAGPIPFDTLTRTSGTDLAARMQTSFTGRTSDKQFDVVRFTVTAVVDQRELLRLIDRITRRNFYQLIGMEYAAVKPNDPDYQQGYLYGAAPVVRARLDFEAYMARNVYEKFFPPAVRERLGIQPSKEREP